MIIIITVTVSFVKYRGGEVNYGTNRILFRA